MTLNELLHHHNQSRLKGNIGALTLDSELSTLTHQAGPSATTIGLMEAACREHGWPTAGMGMVECIESLESVLLKDK